MGDWKVKRYSQDRFEQSWDSPAVLADEAGYHNNIHLLIYYLVTKTGE